jgi:Flp pilus assembly protein TadG
MHKLNQKGSVIIFLTLGFALLGTFIGFALDFGRAYLEKARIARLVDGAALAAAKVLKGQVGLEDAATRAACDSMTMDGASVVFSGGNTCAGTTGSLSVSVNYVQHPAPGGVDLWYVKVQANEPVATTFLRFLGWLTPGDYSTINVSAMAEAGPERPIDLMLVLDRSGSMQTNDGSGTPKSTALKTATSTFLDNFNSSDDHIGMTSFGYRGCAGPTLSGDANTDGDCSADKALGSPISDIKTAVNSLVSNGSTNTMEGFRVAKTQITNAINDPTRSATRKAVLLITDGRPTSSRRFTDSECHQDPITNSTMNDPAVSGTFTTGCIFSVFTGALSQNSQNLIYYNPINAANFGVNWVTGTNGATYYQHFVQFARQTAVDEANAIKNLASKSVLIYVIAIGTIDNGYPGNSLDFNAKCFLGRLANDPNTVSTNCPNVFTTGDNDSYPDLQPCKADPSSCIDNTQQKGRMFTIDMNGNVKQQLDDVFAQVAVLLKLRLTI